MKSSVLYIGLAAAVVFFACKVFTAQLEARREAAQRTEQSVLIYEAQMQKLSSPPTLPR